MRCAAPAPSPARSPPAPQRAASVRRQAVRRGHRVRPARPSRRVAVPVAVDRARTSRLPTLAQRRAAPVLSPGGAAPSGCPRTSAELAIRLANARQPITALSGGNQQKVIVARWLAAEPRVLLLNDPTRGVDLGAKRDLYRLLERPRRRRRRRRHAVHRARRARRADGPRARLPRGLGQPPRSARRELVRTGLVSAFFGREMGGQYAASDLRRRLRATAVRGLCAGRRRRAVRRQHHRPLELRRVELVAGDAGRLRAVRARGDGDDAGRC